MKAKEATEILQQARMLKVYAMKFMYRQDEFEIRFSSYSEAVFKKYEAAKLFLQSIRLEAAS